MENTKIKVMICDQHLIFRSGLKNILSDIENVQIVGEANSVEQLVTTALLSAPDLILLDIGMPGMNSEMLMKQLEKLIPDCKVVGLAVNGHENSLWEMITAGAAGYILKSASQEEIEEVVGTVQEPYPSHYRPASDKKASVAAMQRSNRKAYDVFFTDREKEIINLICKEYTSKQIAHTLFLSKRTVEGHRTRIMCKMGVKSIAGMISYAYRRGLCRLMLTSVVVYWPGWYSCSLCCDISSL